MRETFLIGYNLAALIFNCINLKNGRDLRIHIVMTLLRVQMKMTLKHSIRFANRTSHSRQNLLIIEDCKLFN